MKLNVVNLFGGPGCGKSTLAANIFVYLKKQFEDVELVTEYAKDAVYEKRISALENQVYIFGKQHHRLWRLKDHAKIVINDSPIILSLVYAKNKTEKFNDFVLECFNEQFNNINFLIDRSGLDNYSTMGRVQNKEEAIIKDLEIKKLLGDNKIEYSRITRQTDTVEIVEKIYDNINSLE